MKNKVSIIVPCYNQAPYLSEALESVYTQTYPNWECLIINDGSTDDSEEVARTWFKKDSRFKYFKIENSGVSHARNFAIQHSHGEFILPLDGDDKISTNFIEEAVKKMQQTDITLAYGDTVTFGASKGKWVNKQYDYHRLLHENLICCTAMYRRNDYNNTTGYNENMKQGLEDWDFWLSLLDEKSKVVKLGNVKMYYRRKHESRSKEISKKQDEALKRQVVKNHQELYDKYLPDVISMYHEKFYLDKSVFLFLLRRFAKKILNR